MKVEESKRRYKKGQKRPYAKTGSNTKKPEIQYYQSSQKMLYSTIYKRVYKAAREHYETLITNPHRKPAVKSAYFENKIFLDEFWTNIFFYNVADRRRRLAFYLCAVDLIENSKYEPVETYDKGKKLYELYGKAKNGEKFAVHLRKGTNGIYHMSCFPK